jgi:3-hydroxyacyl-CoA dehydrogenase
MSTVAPLRVGVVGAGTLGATVVRAVLAAGSPVTVLVRGGDVRRRQRAAELAAAVRRETARGHLPAQETEQRLAGLRVTDRMADLADAELVVESVPESASLKREVIAAIEAVVPAATVIASTTSSIPAAVLAAGARHPGRVVVAHFVWPAHRIPLVEVAFHAGTDQSAVARLGRFLAALGKQPVRVADRPGFLITRALFAYWDAAVGLVRDGCPPAAVDDALTGFGWPLGPFAVMEGTTLSSVARIQTDLMPHLEDRFPSLAALSAAVTAGADRIYGPGRSLDLYTGALLCRSDRAAGLGAGPIVERTVGALGDEVDRAVSEGVAASWDEAGAAIDAAYGFPGDRGGLARWWRESRRLPSQTATQERVTVPRQRAVADGIERTPQ